jgi:hypothetical protein
MYNNNNNKWEGTDHLSNELEASGKLHPKNRELLLVDKPLLQRHASSQ